MATAEETANLEFLAKTLHSLESIVLQLLACRPLPCELIELKLCQLEDIVCGQIDPVWQFDLVNRWRLRCTTLWEQFQKKAHGGSSEKRAQTTAAAASVAATFSPTPAVDQKASKEMGDLLEVAFRQLDAVQIDNAGTACRTLKQLLSVVGKSIKLLQLRPADTSLHLVTLGYALEKLPATIQDQLVLSWPPLDTWKTLVALLQKLIIKTDYELYRLNGGRRIHRLKKKYGNGVVREDFCSYCWCQGHRSNSCEQHQRQSLCFRCFEFGHKSKNCVNEALIC